MKKLNPSQFTPRSSADFIGGAATIARVLEGKGKAMLASMDDTAKLLLYGPPGTGKTRLAEMFACLVGGHPTNIESINGRNVTIDVVRRWQEAGRYVPIFRAYTVKIVNELDTAPPAAQDLLLTYLDEMPKCSAFIGTSNLDLRQLVDRFQTRLQQFKVDAPEGEDIHALLRKFKLPRQVIPQIVVGCGGNVRAALLDAQSILDAQNS